MPLRRVLSTSWPPMILTALGVFLLLLRYDVPATDLVAYGVYLLVGIAFPGVVAWRLLLHQLHTRREDGDEPPTWFEDLSLGTIFGFGIQLPVYLLGVWIGYPGLIVVLPIAAAVVSVTWLGRSTWKMPTRSLDYRASWALGATILYGVAWLGRNAFAVRPLSLPGFSPPSVDETFHQALIAETSNRFPPQIPFLLDTRLDYHWFVHAQIATSDHATGIGPIVMLREVMPAVVLGLAVLGLGAVALRLTGRPVAAVIAPALLVAGAYQLIGPHFATYLFTEPYLSKRLVTSPSQPYGVMMSLPALMLILEVLRPGRKAERLTWVALAISLFALSGAKATFTPIFLCGALAVWGLTLVFRRRLDKTLTALIGLLFIVLMFAQVVLFGGQSGGMVFDPFATVRAALVANNIALTPMTRLAMTLTLLISWLLYGIGAVGLLKAGKWRDPRAAWLLLSIPVGIGVAFALFRSGLSQLWFQRTVAEMVVLISAWGMAYLLPQPLTRRHALRYGGAAAGAGLLAYLIAAYSESGREILSRATYRGLVYTVAFPVLIAAIYLVVRLVVRPDAKLRAAALVTAVSVILGLGLMNVYSFAYDTASQRAIHEPDYPNLFAPGGVKAAEYIEHHAGTHDIIATNVHCLRPPGVPNCDNRNFWISAWAERRVVIEGWGYTATTNDAFVPGLANAFIPAPDPERLRINDAAFIKPSARTIDRLVDDYDPSWLFISKLYPANLPKLNALDGSLLTKVFHNKNYVVFRINR